MPAGYEFQGPFIAPEARDLQGPIQPYTTTLAHVLDKSALYVGTKPRTQLAGMCGVEHRE